MTQPSTPVTWRNVALAVAIGTVLGISGCKKPEQAPVAQLPPAGVSNVAPAAASAAVETDGDLLTKAKTAENEKRLYAPAGDNAIEYYLQLRARNPNDDSYKAALTDLFPYAEIATEQTLAKASASKDQTQAGNYRQEAARIFALLERVDVNAPSLPRLRDTMQREASAELKAQQAAATKAQADLEKKADADKQAALAKQQAASAAQSTPSQTSAPERTSAPARAQPIPQPVTQAPPPPPPPVASPVAPEPAQPKPAHAGLPDVISSAQPEYPRDALRDGVSGEVTVSFTVNPDGSVGAASIANSNPRRTFDAAALSAIKKWKFEAPGEPVTGRKTFEFNPGN